MRALGRLVLVAVAVLVGTAGPAAADPPAPSQYRSKVVGLSPEVDGVDVRVAGGDGFLVVTVEPGHEAIVYGYAEDGDQEEYLRFSANGTVERNLRSPATYLNEDRFQQGVEVPGDLVPGEEPEWEVVASGGSYAWHDHRIHFMGTVRQPGQFEEPTPWEVPIRVDGTEVVVEGTLQFLGSTSPLPWVAVAVVVAGAVVVLARKRVAVAAAALSVAGAVALVAAFGAAAAVPPGAGGSPVVTLVLTGLGFGTALLAWWRARTPAGAVLGLASVALLAGWALLRLGVLTNPVLPTDLPFALDRAATALALAAAVAGAVVVTGSGALRLPDLADE